MERLVLDETLNTSVHGSANNSERDFLSLSTHSKQSTGGDGGRSHLPAPEETLLGLVKNRSRDVLNISMHSARDGRSRAFDPFRDQAPPPTGLSTDSRLRLRSALNLNLESGDSGAPDHLSASNHSLRRDASWCSSLDDSVHRQQQHATADEKQADKLGSTATPPVTFSRIASLYFRRFLGPPDWQPSPLLNPSLNLTDSLRSFLGSLLGILLCASIHYSLTMQPPQAIPFVLGSNGATAVLIYGLPSLKASQPRAVILGNLLSAIVGVAIRMLIVEVPGCGECQAIAAALAVSASLLVMHATGTVHPPGGAAALIAVTGEAYTQLGFTFVLVPVLASSMVLVAVGLVVNNAFALTGKEAEEGRGGYPLAWF